MYFFLSFGEIPMSIQITRFPKKYTSSPVVLFDSPEEAWFWFVRCQKLRDSGVRSADIIRNSSRPCDPDDLYRTAMALRRKNRLNDQHLRVMAQYGMLECPPDPRQRSQERAATTWADAMDRMLQPLRSKGIVTMPDRPEYPAGGCD